MEMRLDRLDYNDLPESEIKFIAAMMQSKSLFQNVSFRAEEAIQAIFSFNFKQYNKYNNVVICRIGSGGRFDGAAVGDQEFVIVSKPPRSHEDIAADGVLSLISKLESTGNSKIDEFSSSSIEHKCLSKGSKSLLYHPSRPNHPYPGRILESEFVAGSKLLYQEIKEKVLKEIKQDPKIIRKLKNELQEYVKCCESGISKFKNEEVIQFTNSKSELPSFVAYEPQKGIYGFKYAFLRYYQLAITIAIFQYMRNFDIPPAELVDLPPSVEERLRYLLRKDWINDIDLAILSGHIYFRATDIQASIKSNYYLKSPEERTYEVVSMKGDSVDQMQDAVKRLQNGSLLKSIK